MWELQTYRWVVPRIILPVTSEGLKGQSPIGIFMELSG